VAETFAIETADLKKDYNGVEAVRGLDLRVPAGSIYGLLGRNGAGKTTTIKMLLGMVRPTSGVARVFGLPSAATEASVEIRRRTGFVSEDKDLYDSMTVEQMVRFTAAFFPRWRHDLAARYLQAFELAPDRRVQDLSRGNRAKLALLLALCRGAELLVLDEPTSGLDPAVSEEVLQALVRHVASEPLTVFLSSHRIAEVDQIADHLAILDRGRAAVSGTLDDVRERYCRIQLVFDGDAPEPSLRAPAVMRLQRRGRVLTIISNGGAASVLDEVRALGPASIDVLPLSLKEIFLETVKSED
jgi:ABC-type multidrug transport system ATPase subunit